MKKLTAALVVLGASLFAATSLAHVKTAGDWPKEEKPVTVTIDAPRAEAVQKLAEASGWNIVVPDKLGGGTERLHVAVKDESPLAVLEALLESGDFTATRHGKLVIVSNTKDVGAAPAESGDAATAEHADKAETVAPSVAPVPPVPPVPPVAPVPPAPPAAPEKAEKASSSEASSELGEDRSVMGGNAVIMKGERVHDVSVMGGNLDIQGIVTGDVSVMGGRAIVRDGAHVQGDAVAVGGALDIEKGARVDGDVGVVGGVLHRHDGAIIRGKVVSTGAKLTESDEGSGSSKSKEHGGIKIQKKLGNVGSAVTRAAMLFVFGVVLLSFLRHRYDIIKVDIASHGVKSFATGILALVLALIATVVVSLTVIGIPFVVVGWLFAALCIYGGIVSVLTLAGELVLRHKTENPYVHLAAGCAIYLVLGAIPVVGGIVTALLTFVAIGTVVRTRAGGLFAKEVRRAA